MSIKSYASIVDSVNATSIACIILEKMIFITRKCHPKMIVFAKTDKLLFLGKLKNLETFVKDDQEPTF